MKSSKRRLGFMLGAITAAVPVMLAGCVGPSESDVTTVTMVLWPGPEGDAMQKVVDAYNADQGKEEKINVEMVLLSRDDTFARETTEIGSQSSAVDIYFVATYNVGFFSGGLDPLTDVVIDPTNYFPAAIDGLRIDDEIYALPLDVSNHFLYYRTDLIEKLMTDPGWQNEYRRVSAELLGTALDPKAPEEWDIEDYYAAAAFFSQSANPASPTKYGTALQLKTSPFNTTLWDDLLWGAGGSWSENGKADLDSPEARRVNEIYSGIYTREFTSPDSAQAEYAETNAALQAGSAAFALQWSSAYAELSDPARSPEIADKIAAAPIPGDPHSTHVHSLAIALNKYSNNKDAAATWMSYLATPEAMDAYAKAGGIPSMPAVLADNADLNPGFPLIADQVATFGYSPPIFAGTFEAMTAIAEGLNPVWLGIDTSSDTVTRVNDDLQKLLDKG